MFCEFNYYIYMNLIILVLEIIYMNLIILD